jgi:hypothetical protein
MNYLQGVINRRVYFVNRLPTSFNVYHDNEQKNEKLDWTKIHHKVKKGNLRHIELNVLLGKEKMLPVRLIIEQVPDKIYCERIKKASKHDKSKGCQLSSVRQ